MYTFIFLILECFFIALSPSAWALSADLEKEVSSDFLFIENNVDNEYFITPSSLDPRFSGSNTWVKYRADQDSLGYIGIVSWVADTAYYKDMWIDNSPISEPFRGIRCKLGGNCPNSGYIPAELTDESGFYHTKATGAGATGGHFGFASLTDSAYEFFRNMPVGSSKTLNLNFCRTKIDYDYASGQRCKDQSSGTWHVRPFTLNKTGHLYLQSTNALQDLWLASDGTPSLAKDKGYCELGLIDGESGAICKIVSYKLTGREVESGRKLTLTMKVDSTALGFIPKDDTVKYSGDGKTWVNYSKNSNYNDIFSLDREYIYVFFSKAFLKDVVEKRREINNTSAFSFYFARAGTVQSGYYEFTPSVIFNFVPKEYGISITPSIDTNLGNNRGKIGNSNPIEIDYTVTVSGARQADSITAQVIGDSTTIRNVPYCVFTSAQGGLSVPIPAFLQYNSESGGVVQKRNSCSEAAVSIRDAQWQRMPWEANDNDDGSYYTTDLKLLFSMNDSRSMSTVKGDDWEGVVSASGEIRVIANWIGVTP